MAVRRVAMTELVRTLPCDIASYNEIERDGPSGASVALMELEPAGSVGEHLVAAFDRLAHQHPLVRHYARTGDRRARRISDVMRAPRFHRLDLYRDFFAELGVEHQMAVTLPSGADLVIGLALNRGHRDFSADEAALLDILRPHIVQARGLAAAYEAAQTSPDVSTGAWHPQYGVIRIDHAGRVREATPSAVRWVQEFFGQPLRIGCPPPPPIAEWLQMHRRRPLDDSLHDPAPCLATPKSGRSLHAWRMPGGPTGEGEVVLLRTQDHPPALRGLGRLTEREAQVLGQLAAGAGNREIAERLVLSQRTVEKHLEHIYSKLGVRTRTEAAMAWVAQRGEG